jgi:adenylate cyclase
MVVGYSRLMERDEVRTFERLKQLRKELIEPVLEQYGGCFIDLKCDDTIVEFGSVISAVEAAVEIHGRCCPRIPMCLCAPTSFP